MPAWFNVIWRRQTAVVSMGALAALTVVLIAYRSRIDFPSLSDGNWIFPVAASATAGLVLIHFRARDVRRLAASQRQLADAQRLAEQALRQSEQRLRRILEASPMGAAVGRADGRVLDANDSFLKLIGYTREQMLAGRVSWHRATRPEQMLSAFDAMEQAERRGACDLFEKEYVRPDGTLVPALVAYAHLGGDEFAAFALDISERKRVERELYAAARIDRLTGLPNRALFTDRLQQAMLRHRRLPELKYAVLFLDVDRFKTINDSLGHQAGDELLCEISRRLREALRAVDSVAAYVPGPKGQPAVQPTDESDSTGPTAARLGGDEFVILLDGLKSADDATVVANRLLKALSVPLDLAGHDIVITASIGVVTSELGHQRADDVVRDADTAMYEAKLAGKGRAVVFSHSMRDRVRRKLELEHDLRKALDAGQFFLVYQPIVSLETGRAVSAEALVRWNHPTHGLISPAEFIPLAEETGLIVPLGEWVFREACRQLSAWWRDHGRGSVPGVSVNVSRKQLALPELPRTLYRIAREAGIDPAAIHLEVTESAAMADAKLGEGVLRELKAIGFKVAVDDFGTGHSSLACLHQFPIDVLKIDRMFVTNLQRGSDFASLVNAIVMLTRNLRIQVIAEGVEHADQLSMLQALGCQMAQGYYFAKPLPSEQVVERVTRGWAADRACA